MARVSTHFNTAISAVCEKRISMKVRRIRFDQFVRQCAGEITALTLHFANKWPVPGWVTKDDIRQEILGQLWHWVQRWDSKRGKKYTPGEFVVLQTMWRVARTLHKTMGVSTYRPKNSGGKYWRDFERPLVYGDDGEPLVTAVDERPLPSDAIVARETREARYDYLRELCATKAETIAITALERYNGDLDMSARGILSSSDLARECKVNTFDASRTLVIRSVSRLTRTGDFLEVA